MDNPTDQAKALWDAVRVGLGNLAFSRHCRRGTPRLVEGALVVQFGTEADALKAQEIVDRMSVAAGMPVIVRLAA